MQLYQGIIMYSKLQYISQGETATEQLHNIREAIGAGCKWVQLRFKNATPEELTALAVQVKRICTDQGVTYIINDHPLIAKAVDADGLHVGLTDMRIGDARKILGNNKIIGGTANTLQDILQRVQEGCDYIGLGPFRFTTTKKNLSPILGIEGYKRISDELKLQQISIPVYAIGGIVLEDITAIMQAGIYGIAVSGIITHHPDKKLLLQQINTLLYETVDHSG
ncbi:MAG: thiamine phosphate synthase [Chitinophagaceae bacterium]|nr:thiamine phosphate synthase [Chitinophagaceae bacterium]MDP3128022.1 thiamine phosphate synthase [Sediminibacterium sp.]MDP3667405.1 thiamine phosphate synthase [Sediminibacterium sp.]